MKTLYLMRHAEASHNAAKDFDRELTPKGAAMASKVGQDLAAHNCLPQLIYCSNAVRTKQTSDSVTAQLPTPPDVQFCPDFYGATPEQVLQKIQQTEDAIQQLMIVGHNPWVHILAVTLTQSSSMGGHGNIRFSYPPSSCVVLDFDIKNWATLANGQGLLKNYICG